ncbi:MAG: hypothetical protein WA417_20730 [Stellaceae bacterium]
MAQPLEPNATLAIRLIRMIEAELYPAAVKEGLAAGPAFKYGAVMTRGEARAFRQWAMSRRETRAALLDPAWQDIAQTVLRLTTHFEADHPQTAEGEPRMWPEPVSPAMRAFALRERNDLPTAELLPHEVEGIVNYARLRDPAHFDGEAGERVRGEVEQLIEAAENAPLFNDNAMPAPSAAQEAAMTENPERAAAIEKRDALLADPQFQARYHSPHLNVRRRAIEEITPLYVAIARKTGQEAAGGTAPRESVIAPTVSADMFKTTAAASSTAPHDPAALRAALKGLNSAQRAAKLTELFGAVDAGAGGSTPDTSQAKA